ncbi:MAG: hypothetical protein H6669_04165 [Ardenticatenaceae bacterium]|nr:hypothetical protein [Ardenticatenaceae bacterium]
MNMHFTDILDIALQRQANDEPINAILADYPQQAAALAPLLNAAQALNVVQPVVMPEAEALQADRLQFLAQVEQTLPAPVPNGFLARFNQWTTHQFPWILSTNRRREPKRMNALILKAALVLTLLFGAAGGTAVLAQESLPDSPVYPIKLVLEDARLALNKDGTEETTLHFQLCRRTGSGNGGDGTRLVMFRIRPNASRRKPPHQRSPQPGHSGPTRNHVQITPASPKHGWG